MLPKLRRFHYEYVTLDLSKAGYSDGDSFSRGFVQVQGESKRFLQFVRVNKEAEETESEVKADDTIHETVHLVDKGLIKTRKRYDVSLKYGWLVPEEEARKHLDDEIERDKKEKRREETADRVPVREHEVQGRLREGDASV